MYLLGNPPDYEQPPEKCAGRAGAPPGHASPQELAYDAMLSDEGRGMLYVPFLNYADGNLDAAREMLTDPNAVPGLSDGGAHCGIICDASFPTYPADALDARPQAAAKSCRFRSWWRCRRARPRCSVGLDDRGVIAPGFKADINVIDYDRLHLHPPKVHYDLPVGGRRLLQQVDGYDATIVSGTVTQRGGKATGAGRGAWFAACRVKGSSALRRASRGQADQSRVELLEQDQAIYYDGPHSGHVLTHAQGRIDAGTWADYMNVGMEHGAFDMAGLAEYMRGLVDAGPTRSGHRTPAVIVEAPVNGIDAAHVRYNAWQFRQILGRGVHGILLCQAETADAVRAFVESCRYPHNTIGVDPAIPSPMARMEGAIRRKRRRHRRRRSQAARHRHAGARIGSHCGADLGPVDRGIYGALRSLAAQPERRTAAGREAGKPRRRRQLRRDPRACRGLDLPRSARAI